MRKKIFLLLEILIWFILLLGLFSFAFDCFENYLSARKTFNVSFKDVDGLIVGSPVRMMGIQVGHVIKIKPLINNVDITFVITNEGVTIPDHSSVNIQFTGLAGSKSLEIQPESSENNFSGSPLTVVEPIRIASVLEVNQDITKSILDCSKMAIDMLGNGGLEQIKKNIGLSVPVSNSINNSIIKLNNTLVSIDTSISGKSKGVEQKLANGADFFDYFNNSYFKNPDYTEQSIINILNSVYLTSKYIENNDWDKYFYSLNKNINTSRQNIRIGKFYLQHFNCNIIDNAYQSVNMFSQGCSAVNQYVESNLSQNNIKLIRNKTNNLKKNIRE